MPWEYLIITTTEGKFSGLSMSATSSNPYFRNLENKTLIEVLNWVGVRKWELVGTPVTIDTNTTTQVFFFKRPIETRVLQ